MNFSILDKHHASMYTPHAPPQLYNIYIQECTHGYDALAETKKPFVDFTPLVFTVMY